MIQPEEVTILKNSIAKGASDEELKFCLTVARRYKLDPFKQQIWFVPRWDSNAENSAGGTGARVWSPQVGINGLLFAAARDHREEFGSISKPQYGPETSGHPEWSSVKITKKNGSVTEAEARWSEYAPADLSKAPFWRKMPYRMLGKCATALAVREAYPDLGGLYIPEEMEKMNEEYTKEGRRIIEKAGLDVPQMGTHAAGQAVAAAKIAELRQAKEAAEPLKSPPRANKPDPLPPMPSNGTVEVEWLEKDAIVRGDLADLLEQLKVGCAMSWIGDWWHVTHEDVKTIGEICAKNGYKFQELLPKSSPVVSSATTGHTAATGGGARAGRSTPPAAETKLVVGTIEEIFAPPNTKSPMRQVKVRLPDGKKPTFGCFKHDLFSELDKAKGAIEVYVTKTVKADKTYFNIVGLKRLGSKEWMEDGTPVVQRKDQEAGQPTLYPR